MTRIALASLFAFGLAAGAAQASTGNVVGGGGATMAGGSDDRTITYSMGGAGGGASFEQVGRLVTFTGNDGDGARWSYGTPTTTNPGREAWVIGGGDDAQVVYTQPR